MRSARRSAHGQVCQEERDIRTFCALLIALSLGCGGPKLRPVAPDPTPPPQKTVHSGAGEATYRGVGGGQREWFVSWESAQLDIGPDGRIGGSMEKVRGVLFRNDEEASEYSADRAEAIRDTGVLKLSGHVRVAAFDRGSSGEKPAKRDGGPIMECDSVEWKGGEAVVKARGNVRVRSKEWTAGPAPELWATPDLNLVGTPERFKDSRR